MEAGGGDGDAAGAETMRDEVPLETAWGQWEESLRGGAAKAGAPGPTASAPPTPEPAAPEPKARPVETPVAPPPATPPEPIAPPAPATVRGPEVKEAKPAPPAVAAGALERPRPSAEKGGRAAAVRESLRPRVERVRDASRGVFEEAAEDSGLRFVLISVALFLVFLLFLLLNSRLR